MAIRTKGHEPPVEPLPESAIAELRRSFRGQLITPTDDAYDMARQVWNAMIDHHPALIARCLGVGDVTATIALARSEGLDISVRGGGHSIVGHSVADGAVVVDLSLMRGVHVDRAERRAVVQGGAWIADLDRECQHFGLATTGGVAADTGVGGYTLGGGYGYLAPQFGLACDNLQSVELVTADGTLHDVNAETEPELMWALRGAGANFGVATSFTYSLQSFVRQISYGDAWYGISDGVAALRAMRQFIDDLPREMSWGVWGGTASPALPVPPEHRGEPMIQLSWIWLGEDPAQGERLGQRLHEIARPAGEVVERTSYVDLQTGGALVRPRRRSYWKSSFVHELTDDVIEAFVAAEIETNLGREGSSVEMIGLGGAIADTDEAASAYSHRSAIADFIAVASWEDPSEDDERMAAARRAWEMVASKSNGGVYVNNLGIEGLDRVREAYGPEKYDRLASLKRTYDPDNVFHHNQNVPPAPQ